MLKWWQILLTQNPSFRWGRILDPACRRGEILSYLFYKHQCGSLYGLDKDRSLSKVWFKDKTVSKMNLDHFITADYLTYDWGDLKFDRILVTPSYDLTKAYVEKSLNLLNKDGLLVVMQKPSWVKDQADGRWLIKQPIQRIIMVPKHLNGNEELFIHVFRKDFKGQPAMEWLGTTVHDILLPSSKEQTKKRFYFKLNKSKNRTVCS